MYIIAGMRGLKKEVILDDIHWCPIAKRKETSLIDFQLDQDPKKGILSARWTPITYQAYPPLYIVSILDDNRMGPSTDDDWTILYRGPNSQFSLDFLESRNFKPNGIYKIKVQCSSTSMDLPSMWSKGIIGKECKLLAKNR